MVVAPSGPCNADRVRSGAEIATSWGLSVRYGRHVLGVHQNLSYLSAGDRTRADDFSAAWCHPDVSAVWAARGGYGAQRMVDLIDFDALRAAGPKHFIGFSDTTALHARIGRELGQVTVHGPVMGSLAQLTDPPSARQMLRLIMERPVPGMPLCAGRTVVAGTGTGVLIGGNLSLIASDLGIEPAPQQPSILLVEDIDEEGYRVDRMLTQLQRLGWFSHVEGVVIGDFTNPGDADLLQRVVADRLAGLGIPLVSGVQVGHGDRNLALPLGAAVRLQADGYSGRGVLLLG
ncbi:MAG: LD-carboxypeptidase [Propionibacteriaceae bacterium]|nr:LD-carboxypeptidase [Propionibacteriaceae bacterium]